MIPSDVPAVGFIVVAIINAKTHEDVAAALKFVGLPTHLHPDEKKQILFVLQQKKAELQRISDMAFLGFESALKIKAEAPPATAARKAA